MHAALLLLGFWAAAFATLCGALVLLNVFDEIIQGELMLKSARTEAMLAGVASLIEGVSLWLMVTYVPGVWRALAFPVIIVMLIYRVGHLEDWKSGHVFMLLIFQVVLVVIGVSLFLGQFGVALVVALAFGLALGVLAAFSRGL
jgi:hypothetical protein